MSTWANGRRAKKYRKGGWNVHGNEQRRQSADAQPSNPSRTMTLLVILEQARRRNAAEAAYAYINSEEGKAMALELNRLRAACEAAEANYLATCARCDAERKAEVSA